jgi:hypothetical protein
VHVRTSLAISQRQGDPTIGYPFRRVRLSYDKQVGGVFGCAQQTNKQTKQTNTQTTNQTNKQTGVANATGQRARTTAERSSTEIVTNPSQLYEWCLAA